MNAFRRSRHQAVYDWDDAPPDDPASRSIDSELAELDINVRRVIELGRAWLAAERPAIVSILQDR